MCVCACRLNNSSRGPSSLPLSSLPLFIFLSRSFCTVALSPFTSSLLSLSRKSNTVSLLWRALNATLYPHPTLSLRCSTPTRNLSSVAGNPIVSTNLVALCVVYGKCFFYPPTPKTRAFSQHTVKSLVYT